MNFCIYFLNLAKIFVSYLETSHIQRLANSSMSKYYLKRSSRERKSLRITISVEGVIEEKIKEIQRHLFSYTGEEWSMSKIINMILLGGILADKKLGIQDWYTIKRFTEGRYADVANTEVANYIINIAALRQVV